VSCALATLARWGIFGVLVRTAWLRWVVVTEGVGCCVAWCAPRCVTCFENVVSSAEYDTVID
jgi:hypothetical protein